MIAVLVFGSRDLREHGPVWTVLNGIAASAGSAESIVIEGGAPGADARAARWAANAPWPNIQHEQYPPDHRRADNCRF